MAKRTVTVFYAWQSDRDQKGNRHFIRRALDDAAKRINEDGALGVEIKIDADTEGVLGTPAVTETILGKIYRQTFSCLISPSSQKPMQAS